LKFIQSTFLLLRSLSDLPASNRSEYVVSMPAVCGSGLCVATNRTCGSQQWSTATSCMVIVKEGGGGKGKEFIYYMISQSHNFSVRENLKFLFYLSTAVVVCCVANVEKTKIGLFYGR
jgi:hypothetical protein